MPTKSYSGSCHCGAVRIRFTSDEITSGIRCNCSMCIRRGSVMSSEYIPADAFDFDGIESLTVYQFGDRSMQHYFCKRCGICPFSAVVSLPPDYRGRARVGDRRINLGCIDGLDPLALPTQIIDGKSF
jgi:hypothetical protein